MSAQSPPRQGAVRGVILDFYGTLVRLVEPLPPSHRSFFLSRGLVEAADKWGDQWTVGPRDGEEHTAHSTSERAYHTWELDRLRRRALACGVPGAAAGPLAADLDRAMKDLRLALFDDVPAALAGLRARGLTVAVCSNWFWDLDRAIEDVGIAGLVDIAVTSARAGARKPHPLIYRTVLEQCGLRPEQAVFVGDMWESDVAGPLAYGMRAVHLWRPDRVVAGAAPSLPDGAARIASLTALSALV
ncbi:HAD family hydrolase [Streptomyces yunnanensis]|uniref:HAD family hydrolase n=1 Tax=Streptomyces yunnanensis TaxID=156453 RepID=A0ABY8A2I1_9ACTN|nr:HAD family hydrolase [Streptomyces yunnanensis]WEB38511.1 HAD family hydrolase [Streptomyces yunnanensis]